MLYFFFWLKIDLVLARSADPDDIKLINNDVTYSALWDDDGNMRLMAQGA